MENEMNLEMERAQSLVALINTYNEMTAPYVARTESEHKECSQRAKISLGSIRRNFTLNVDYKELSNGMLWIVK